MEFLLAKQITNLKTLSQSLGLSQTTVSRALNGFPEVNEETRRRVIAAAQLHNYRPSASAASLATGKSRAIGHVVPLSDHMMINPHFSDFTSGAGEIYASHGYDMLIRVVPAQEEEQVYRDFALRNRVDGVVVHGPLVDDPRIPLLKSLNMPFVVHGRSDHEMQAYSWLDVNNRSAFDRATGFLIELGHKRIALLNGLEQMNFAMRRRQGYEQALRRHALDVDPTIIASQDMVEPYGYRKTMELLNSANPPTAFLVSSVLVALGTARAISEAGLQAGRDVSLITFDDRLSFLQSASGNQVQEIPFFTSMRSSIRDAGKRVAEMLLQQISDKPTNPTGELWEAEFVIGKTTGPLQI
jgi:LacI family transcriptional regulator